jgi:PAS domain S-box-containing protein
MPSILIVEDERIIARDLQQMLTELGYDVYATASNADDALAKAAERRPDLVLMDIRIEGSRDGVETARILQSFHDVPVVFLTAHADDATIARATQTAPYGYLIKPVKPADLRSAVEVSIFRHGIEHEVRERERWLTTTLDAIVDAVIAVDVRGHVTYMNPAAASITGTCLADARDQPSQSVLRLAQIGGQPLEETPLEVVLRTQEADKPVELELLRPDGRLSVIGSASPVLDGRKLLGAVLVFRDITQQKRLERQLFESARLASLGAMAAGLAHEVSNPLAVVMTNAGMLEDDLQATLSNRECSAPRDELDALFEMLHDLKSGASRIARIVQDLREFSRPAAEVQPRADVGRAIEWAVRATSREFHHRARVLTEVPSLPPVAIDELRLGQLLVNLLLNAAQAIAPGHIDQNQVRIEAARDATGDVILRISDSGCGIPVDELGHIFEPFHTTKPVGAGMGLGLSVCRNIAAAAGGSISVSSTVGEGSTFSVLLPIAAGSSAFKTAALTSCDSRRANILVIDDDPMVLSAFRRSLVDHDVVCLDQANDALNLLSSGHTFDLIVCDLLMPQMSGMEFYGSLLSQRPQDAARILFVTGAATTEVREFLDTVPNAHIDKPLDSATLRGAISRLLNADEKSTPKHVN